MMGKTKAATVRTKLRDALNMSDTDLIVWFDTKMKGSKDDSKPKVVESLLLFRDALLKETNRKRNTSKAKGPANEPKI